MPIRAKVRYVTLQDIEEMLAPYETVFEMTTDEMMALRRRGLLDTPHHGRWATYAAMRDQARQHESATAPSLDVAPGQLVSDEEIETHGEQQPELSPLGGQ